MKLCASLYAADPLRLADAIEAVDPYVDAFHIDVMDGRFTPHFGLSERVVAHVKRHSSRPVDVHLMVEDPQRHVVRFAGLGARNVAFHLDQVPNPDAIVAEIRKEGSRPYAALRHTTPVSALLRAVDCIDGLLFLTAPAGGGPFDAQAFERLATRPRGLPVIVDGQVNSHQFEPLMALGVDAVVIGTALFASPSPAETARSFQEALAPED
jgi:ribulose-phosphate 3-epimerase